MDSSTSSGIKRLSFSTTDASENTNKLPGHPDVKENKVKQLTCSKEDLCNWNVLKPLEETTKCEVKSFCIFRAGGGTGALLITNRDTVIGLCTQPSDAALFGMSSFKNTPPATPFLVNSLCHLKLSEIDIGVTVGAGLDSSGGLYWWGKTGPNEGESQMPQKVRMFNPSPVFVKVCCGGRFMAGLGANGRVYIWGRLITTMLECEELTLRSPVDSIACGAMHIAVLCQSGTVYTYGGSLNGQRGREFITERDTYLVTKLEVDEPCEAVVCGPISTVALTSSGEIFACGNNNKSMGLLGVKTRRPKVRKPEAVTIPGKAVAIQVAWPPPALNSYVLYAALNADNELYTWGSHELRHTPVSNDNSSILRAFFNSVTPRHSMIHVVQLDPMTESSISESIFTFVQQSDDHSESGHSPELSDQSLTSSIEVLSITSSDDPSKLKPESSNCHTSTAKKENSERCTTSNDLAKSVMCLAAELFGNSRLSDITFILSNCVFPGHRFFLCSRSDKFRQILDLDTPAEKSPVTNHFESHDPVAVKGLLQYFYTGNYAVSELDNLLELHSLALFFEETELIEDSMNDIIDLLEPDNLLTVINKARAIPSSWLMNKCESYITFLNLTRPSEMAKVIVYLAMGSEK